jgi:hypothetical protein
VNHQPRTGQVLCSPASEARFLVLEPGTSAGLLSLDGLPLVDGKPRPCSTVARVDGDSELAGGQRYVDEVSGLVLRCIWPGQGSVRFDGRPLAPEPEVAMDLCRTT